MAASSIPPGIQSTLDHHFLLLPPFFFLIAPWWLYTYLASSFLPPLPLPPTCYISWPHFLHSTLFLFALHHSFFHCWSCHPCPLPKTFFNHQNVFAAIVRPHAQGLRPGLRGTCTYDCLNFASPSRKHCTALHRVMVIRQQTRSAVGATSKKLSIPPVNHTRRHKRTNLHFQGVQNCRLDQPFSSIRVPRSQQGTLLDALASTIRLSCLSRSRLNQRKPLPFSTKKITHPMPRYLQPTFLSHGSMAPNPPTDCVELGRLSFCLSIPITSS